MNAISADERLRRLEKLVPLDPQNELLLADAADAAIAARAFDRAEELLGAGMTVSATSAPWRFRLATLRIAQRRLGEARSVLGELQIAHGAHPGIAHNLAYVEFLDGNYQRVAEIAEPWIDKGATGEPALMQTMWLRAMHHLGALDVAWQWSDAQYRRGQLGAQAAGVASLIALDLSHVEAAASLSQTALDAGIRELEPLVARGTAALAAGELPLAKQLLNEALALSPEDGRSWSTLGLIALQAHDFAAGRTAFEQALRTMSSHSQSWQGHGWACLLAGDPATAASSFDKAIALDDSDAEAHGARAVVHALQSETGLAQAAIQRAQAIDSASRTAWLAQEIMAGKSPSEDDLLRARRLH